MTLIFFFFFWIWLEQIWLVGTHFSFFKRKLTISVESRPIPRELATCVRGKYLIISSGISCLVEKNEKVLRQWASRQVETRPSPPPPLNKKHWTHFNQIKNNNSPNGLVSWLKTRRSSLPSSKQRRRENKWRSNENKSRVSHVTTNSTNHVFCFSLFTQCRRHYTNAIKCNC